jgi:large subunit ribosomal protein L9
MTIQLILRKDVPSLGRLGDVVKVAPGYARNYLLPRGLAMKITPANLKQLEAEKKKAEKERAIWEAELTAHAEKIGAASCTVAAKANEEGHLYGSVDEKLIAEAFVKDGLQVDPKSVEIESPIKELGVYHIKVRLSAEVIAETKVWVVEDKDQTGSSGEEPPSEGE